MIVKSGAGGSKSSGAAPVKKGFKSKSQAAESQLRSTCLDDFSDSDVGQDPRGDCAPPPANGGRALAMADLSDAEEDYAPATRMSVDALVEAPKSRGRDLADFDVANELQASLPKRCAAKKTIVQKIRRFQKRAKQSLAAHARAMNATAKEHNKRKLRRGSRLNPNLMERTPAKRQFWAHKNCCGLQYAARHISGPDPPGWFGRGHTGAASAAPWRHTHLHVYFPFLAKPGI